MTTADELELIEMQVACQHDPLKWAQYAFPWETGKLPDSGPREWQANLLDSVGKSLRENPYKPVRIAVASGHGIGKSATVSMLISWAMSTMEDTRITVTAGTMVQLMTKTAPEINKWQAMAINAHYFQSFATSIQSVQPKHERSWRCDMIPWSAENSDAFGGLHNKGKRLVIIFDESSAIHDRIWEAIDGAMTDAETEIVWLAFGNPLRNNGRFHSCFGKDSHRWTHLQIDSRTVEGTNVQELKEQVEANGGEDSDLTRSRIRGLFPRAGSNQLISSELLREAAHRPLGILAHQSDPVVIGVDVARFGDDENCLTVRCGLDCRKWQQVTWRGMDLMQSAAKVMEVCEDLRALGIPVSMIFVDQTGVGGGVVDRLRQMGYPVTGVDNGGSSNWDIDGEMVKNKGAEMWVRARAWLRSGGAIINDSALIQQLESRQYGYNEHNQIVLERKDDMKKRGLSSPDRADSFCLTFAYPVALMDARGEPMTVGMKSEYNPLAYLTKGTVGKARSQYDPLRR